LHGVNFTNVGASNGSVASELSASLSLPDVDLPDNHDINSADGDAKEDINEGHLQNIVTFPVAFSNAALHEVELLKLLHQIGAPNHAFQSVMFWARKADENNYHFQPSPQWYESQNCNLTSLAGMSPCRPTVSKASLELDNLVLDVVVFPFATILSLLFNCPMGNKIETGRGVGLLQHLGSHVGLQQHA
jgi:hypothetical protein